METLINQIKMAKEMKDSEVKRKEFNDRMVKITNKYQKIYKFDINKNYKGHETWNNEADAFKHAFGSALMVFEMGEFGSFAGGIDHEYKTNNNPKNEWNMDSWNNREGRNIAKEIKKEYGEKNFRNLPKEKQEDIIAHKVMVRMKNGDLITTPEDKRIYKGSIETAANTIKDFLEKTNKTTQQKGAPIGYAAPITEEKRDKEEQKINNNNTSFFKFLDTMNNIRHSLMYKPDMSELFNNEDEHDNDYDYEDFSDYGDYNNLDNHDKKENNISGIEYVEVIENKKEAKEDIWQDMNKPPFKLRISEYEVIEFNTKEDYINYIGTILAKEIKKAVENKDYSDKYFKPARV